MKSGELFKCFNNIFLVVAEIVSNNLKSGFSKCVYNNPYSAQQILTKYTLHSICGH